MTQFKPGDEVYGVTNPEFIGAHAEFALVASRMVARKPESLSFTEAASVPVVAVTAWRMLFEYAKAKPDQTVLIHGAGGNVGAYAVQLASQAGLHAFATASADDAQYVRSLGATTVITINAAGSKNSRRWSISFSTRLAEIRESVHSTSSSRAGF